MTINPYIAQTYPTVSLNEDMENLAKDFSPETFYVVVNNDKKPVGIVTYYDFLQYPRGSVENCSFVKPRLSPEYAVTEAFMIMAKEGCNVLPVYKKGEFVGVVNHQDLSFSMAGQCKGYKQLFKNTARSLRSPLANLLGITKLLELEIEDYEKSEIVELAARSCKKAFTILGELEELEQRGVTSTGFLDTELNSFIKKSINTIPVYTKKIQIRFTPSDVEYFYPVNRLNFREAIQNLISDVISFSNPFGKIDINGEVKGNTYTLKIFEEGERMPEYLKNSSPKWSFTEPSYRMHQEVYFIKTCIEGHNGRIWFDNLKEGTLISIEFNK